MRRSVRFRPAPARPSRPVRPTLGRVGAETRSCKPLAQRRSASTVFEGFVLEIPCSSDARRLSIGAGVVEVASARVAQETRVRPSTRRHMAAGERAGRSKKESHPSRPIVAWRPPNGNGDFAAEECATLVRRRCRGRACLAGWSLPPARHLPARPLPKLVQGRQVPRRPRLLRDLLHARAFSQRRLAAPVGSDLGTDPVICR